MRFNGICLITSDVRRLRDFYQLLLEVQPEGDDTFTDMRTRGASLSIFAEEGMEGMAPESMRRAEGGRFTLEFEVGDVDHEYERLQGLGIPTVKPPTTQPWGRRSAWFRDPDGNIVNLYANADC